MDAQRKAGMTDAASLRGGEADEAIQERPAPAPAASELLRFPHNDGCA
jgi:hypothetical protein